MELNEVRDKLEELPEIIYEKDIAAIGMEKTARLLDDQKKILLNRLKLKFTGSNAEREMHAYADEEYNIHVVGINEAWAKAQTLKAEVKRYERFFEAMRSLNKNII